MPKKLDITGQRYGLLTVLEEAPHVRNATAWRCKCDCGNECIVTTAHLRNGGTTSCGCKSLAHRNAKADLVGRRFGRLLVVSHLANKGGHRVWLCECACGNTIEATTYTLMTSHKRSCGCLASESIATRSYKHGGASRSHRDRLWGVWAMMKDRCLNPNNKSYKYYGELGVKVCDEWLNDYGAFRQWAYANGYDEDAPLAKHTCTLDRINPFGDYEPSNCRWADAKIQNLNKRGKAKSVYPNH